MNPNTLIGNIMTSMPITVTSTSSLPEINTIFEENTFHHIPVVDQGKLVGIISRQDFLQIQHVLSSGWDRGVGSGDSYHSFVARDFMTEYPMYLGPEDTVGLAADIFLSNKFHALPILEDDVLVGIITAHDLISYAYTSPIEEVQ